MAWSTSNRAKRLPGNWYVVRRVVLQRDEHRCTARLRDDSRGPRRATDVDHIVPGDNHDLGNLQSLCRWHHKQKTAVESAAARRASRGRQLRRRPAEEHPGVRRSAGGGSVCSTSFVDQHVQ